MTTEQIKERAFQISDWVAQIRHQLHRIPENGFQEYKTQALIQQTLDHLGIPYTSDRTWVVGLIKGEYPGKTVALRADMDGLPILEKTGLPYASEHPGFMHACGHDTHVAMVLGAARILNEWKSQLHGNVKLLFQPAEETLGGAQPMIEAGCLENPHVDYIYGLHVGGNTPVGTVGFKYGVTNGSSDELVIDVAGRSGHGAHPENAVDAIVIAGQMITLLQSLVSRNVSPIDAAVISIGTIQGGTAHNIIAQEVHMRGTLRTLKEETREKMLTRIREVVEGVAAAMGGSAALTVKPGYCALNNPKEQGDHVVDLATRLFGSGAVVIDTETSLGVEDFAYYLKKAPGAFFHLGCATPGAPRWPGHHPLFSPDERCFPYGVAMHVGLVMETLSKENKN